MASTLHVLLSENNIAPYEFKNDSGVLGAVNPILFGYLLKANDLQELSPGLVKKWSYDFKKQTYTLELDNFKFHNGRTLTAQDIEFSIVRGFISKVENYNRIHFSDILGIEKLQVGEKYKPGMVEGIRTLNDKTLTIQLARKNPLFLLAFSIPFTPVVPQEELGDDYYTWKRFPIGAGPYRLKGAYSNHEIELERVQSSDMLPKKIVYHNKRRPEIAYDLIFPRVELNELEKTYSASVSRYPTSINALFFYRGKPLNENLHFRKALYHGINRARFAEDIPHNKAAYEMMVRPYGGRIHAKDPYDPKIAAEHAAKIPKELLAKPTKVGVYVTEKQFLPSTLRRIAFITEDLKSIGIPIIFEPNLEKFPTPEVLDRFDMKQMAKVVDLVDPAISFGAMAGISPYAKEIPDSRGEYDRLYGEALKSQTFEERIAAVEKIAKLIEEQALLVPLIQQYVTHRFNPKTIESLGMQAQPMFLNLANIVMKSPTLAQQ